jgi:hypothetical protein
MAYDLKIHLDEPYNRAQYRNHVFGPGDKISGKVVFSPKSDEDVESIYIEFKGKCKTQHGRGDDERKYECEMFRLYEKLFKGPYKMRAAVYEYPFSFTFPGKFTYTGCEFRDEGIFRGQAGPGMLELPPSFTDDGSYSGECEVYYDLTAKILRTFMDWENKVYFCFSPWRKEVDVPEESRIMKTYETHHVHYRLTKEGVPRPLTKTEAFKEGFRHKAETKTVNYSLEAKAPPQIVIGKPYQVEITLKSKDAETLGVTPEFKIKSYELLLKKQTDIRVPGAFVDHYNSLDGHVPLSSSSRLNVVLPVNEATKFKWMFSTRGPFPPPTFTSLAIRRTYGLELKAVVECFGEEEKFKIQWANVKVLPSRMEDGVEEAIRGLEMGTASLNVGEGERVPEGLPAYESGHEALPRYEKHVDGDVLGS